MPVTPTYTGATPTVDADEDTWGGELNDALGDIAVDLDALADQSNDNETKADAALPKAGGTMTGELRLGNPTTVSADSAGFRGAPVIDFDANKTIALAEAGKTLRLIGTTARTLTIPPVGTVGFTPGTAIVLRNVSTQAMTIARGSGVTLTLTGSATNKNCTLAPRGRATLLMDENNVWDLGGFGVG